MRTVKETLCTRCAHRNVCIIKETYMNILEALNNIVIDKGEGGAAMEAAVSSSDKAVVERCDDGNEKAACSSETKPAVMSNSRFIKLVDIPWVKPIIPECIYYLRGRPFGIRGGDEYDG